MAHIPSGLINLLEQIEEKNIASVCQKLHITDTVGYKSYSMKVAKRNCEKEYLLKVFKSGGDLQRLYNSIENYLFIGGCVPGVGVAFNIIDACFCAALGNWLGAFVAIISCFPIPGFKVVGKGIEKGMSLVLKELVGKISLFTATDGLKMLEKQMTKIGLYGIKKQGSYTINFINLKPIEEQFEQMFLEWHNPFAENVVREIFKFAFSIQKRATKTVAQYTGDFAKYDVKNMNVTKFGSLLIK